MAKREKPHQPGITRMTEYESSCWKATIGEPGVDRRKDAKKTKTVVCWKGQGVIGMRKPET